MIKVDGTEIDWHEGMTVADLLKELGDGHHYPVVRIGHKIVTRPHFQNTAVPDNTEMHLMHLIAGG
jgi:thiamine biosynthesis protein ThiS